VKACPGNSVRRAVREPPDKRIPYVTVAPASRYCVRTGARTFPDGGASISPQRQHVMRSLGWTRRCTRPVSCRAVTKPRVGYRRILFDVPLAPMARDYGMRYLILHRGDLQPSWDALTPGRSSSTTASWTGETQARRSPELRNRRGAGRCVIGADVSIPSAGFLQVRTADLYACRLSRDLSPRVWVGEAARDTSKWWSDERLPAKKTAFHHLLLTSRRDEVYFVTGSRSRLGCGIAPFRSKSMRSHVYEGFHPEGGTQSIDACPEAANALLTRPPLERWHEGVSRCGDACTR